VKPEQDIYLDLAGLASYSSLGRTTLRELIQQGEIPAYCPRGKILVKRSDFDEWVSRHRVKPQAEVNQIVRDVMEQLREAKGG
jgi:excisionase family DNA binding protein